MPSLCGELTAAGGSDESSEGFATSAAERRHYSAVHHSAAAAEEEPTEPELETEPEPSITRRLPLRRSRSGPRRSGAGSLREAGLTNFSRRSEVNRLYHC